ncbi:MAG: 3-dehydroquinate synthase [Planctomycetota bacterium]
MDWDQIEIDFGSGVASQLLIASGWLTGNTASFDFPGGLSELPTKLLIVCDTNTESIARSLVRRLNAGGRQVHCEVLPSGEQTKATQFVERLWSQMALLGLDRSSALIAVGGGVVGDLSGFAAATFMRGISWFVVPTTLVAQVDSAIGGKVGINLPEGKNLIGSFWQPKGIWIDTTVLGTLPEREYLSGFAEVVKYGVISDPELFGFVEQHVAELRARDPECLKQVIVRCCRIKAEIVAADERELRGLRATLNYGHTFGHAIERVAGYGEYLHGEAVAIGMTWAARAARRLQLVDRQFELKQTKLLREMGLPVDWPAAPVEKILQAMKFDKKRKGNDPRLILPLKVGQVESREWPGDNLVMEAINEVE